MATGNMEFGADNDAGNAQTSLTSALPSASQSGSSLAVYNTADGNAVYGSANRNGVQGRSFTSGASGVYGENLSGGWGVAGRTRSDDFQKAGVLGDSPEFASGVKGYSAKGYGGYFETGQINTEVPYANSGGLRVIGPIVKSDGEYIEALRHTDGSMRMMYAPMAPDPWFEDYGRAEVVDGTVEVALDPVFVGVTGLDDDDYHVFVTPEGETAGLFVASRGSASFVVREQQDGRGTVSFSYRVATRNRRRRPDRFAELRER